MLARRALLTAALLAFILVSSAFGGDPAPPFSVRTFEGKVVRLADLRGKPVVVDFWATWCRPCRASMPHLEEVQKRFSSEGLVVIGLSVDEGPPAEVRRYAQDLGVTFRLGMANEKVLDQYGPIRFLPTTFFINRRGEMVRRVKGYIDSETLETYIRELF